MKKIILIFIPLLISLSLNAKTQETEVLDNRPQVITYCIKPNKPIGFTSQAEKNMWDEMVSNYSICIKNFIENENKILEAHNKVLDEAINDWNEFLKENQ